MSTDYIRDRIPSAHRLVAVHASSSDTADDAASIVSSFMKVQLNDVVLFAPHAVAGSFTDGSLNAVCFPDDAVIPSKQKNFILDWCKSAGFNGFLHIIETSVKPNASTCTYMSKLESTMTALDYDIHFSTATDPCNYVFKKFCPRLTMHIDDTSIRDALDLPDSIHFTSHSNTAYTTWNFGALSTLPKFDERFSVGMFYIIEFLARRRLLRRDDQLYYMNQYLAISDEIGGYDISMKSNSSEVDNSIMEKENSLFRSMNIDYSPDNNIDIVLDTLYKKLKSKMQ